MKWTARANQKGSYKSSGQSFRTQGARLAVLVARHVTTSSLPVPGSPSGELEVHRTRDLEEPVEITLKELVLRAWSQGEYDDAVELSTSYLSIIKRRADATPLELEPDLAGAYLLKGTASFRPNASWKREAFDVGEDALDVLEKARASFTTLSELDPQNDKHQTDLFEACLALSVAYEVSGQLDEAVQMKERVVSIADELAATQA